MLLRRGVESRRDNRSWRPQQRGKEVVEVDMALPRRADHTREDLLGPRAAGRAIPATDLAIDDGGADGVFGAPLVRPRRGPTGRRARPGTRRRAKRWAAGRAGAVSMSRLRRASRRPWATASP